MTGLTNMSNTNGTEVLFFQILLTTNIVQSKDNGIAWKDSIN